MDTPDRQEELRDISLALEEEALILALFGQLLDGAKFEAAPKAVQARLLYRLSDYLNQHAADLKCLCQQKKFSV